MKPSRTLPARSNPLVVRVGKKLRRVREARGLGYDRAAEQLGISTGMLRYLEEGVAVPGPIMCKRIYQWAVGGIHFEGAGKPSNRPFKDSDQRLLKVAMPKDSVNKLRGEAKRLGMSMSALALLFIRQGLTKRAGFHTLGTAVDEIQKAEAIQLLRAVPELRDFLEADIDICQKAGEALTSWNQLETLRPDIEKIDALPTSHLKLNMDDEYLEEV